MANKAQSLYRVNTIGCGSFYVVAHSFDMAFGVVMRELNEQGYGFSAERVVTSIDFICRQTFSEDGTCVLSGDENHLMIPKEE